MSTHSVAPTVTQTVSSTTASIVTFAERQQEKFPLNTFFSLQPFKLYHGTVDFVGRILEYPLSIIQL